MHLIGIQFLSNIPVSVVDVWIFIKFTMIYIFLWDYNIYTFMIVMIIKKQKQKKKRKKNKSPKENKTNQLSPANNYLFKVNNRNIRKRCEICSKLTIKTPGRCPWIRFDVFIVHFEHMLAFSTWISCLSLRRVPFFSWIQKNLDHVI